jgi:hypothetical protein
MQGWCRSNQRKEALVVSSVAGPEGDEYCYEDRVVAARVQRVPELGLNGCTTLLVSVYTKAGSSVQHKVTNVQCNIGMLADYWYFCFCCINLVRHVACRLTRSFSPNANPNARKDLDRTVCRKDQCAVSSAIHFRFVPINDGHVALSYLRMYACSPGTLWGEHPSEQVESIVP